MHCSILHSIVLLPCYLPNLIYLYVFHSSIANSMLSTEKRMTQSTGKSSYALINLTLLLQLILFILAS